MLIIGGDVGGTKTNAGLFDASAPDDLGRAAPRVVMQYTYASPEFSGLEEIVADFVRRVGERRSAVRAACFGIAGPVIDGRCKTPNLPWEVDGEAIGRSVGLPSFTLINDLVANAEGIGALLPDELAVIQQGSREPDQTRTAALIAPGTGLGMAILAPGAEGEWVAVASEGGHADFAPRGSLEIELLGWLRKRYPDHVSYERVVCGAGLVAVYEFLVERGAVEQDAPLYAEIAANPRGAPRAISDAGIDGRSSVAIAALDLFVRVYGAMAGNLALIALATGGVFLGGGISPKIRPRIEHGPFLEAFWDKGRFRALMETLPVRLILNPDTAMLGAARHAARTARRARSSS